jgi:hypothetical protein
LGENTADLEDFLQPMRAAVEPFAKAWAARARGQNDDFNNYKKNGVHPDDDACREKEISFQRWILHRCREQTKLAKYTRRKLVEFLRDADWLDPQATRWLEQLRTELGLPTAAAERATEQKAKAKLREISRRNRERCRRQEHSRRTLGCLL